MLAQYLDLKDAFNNNYSESMGLYSVVFEVSNYDYAVIQISGSDAGINLESTIDSGAIQGVTDGNALTSDNYFGVYKTIIGSGSVVDGTFMLGDDMVRVDVVGRYIKLSSETVISPSGFILVMLAKIS
jgi:hypothetical protein